MAQKVPLDASVKIRFAVLAATPRTIRIFFFCQRTAVQEDRLKPTVIFQRDVNRCSHIESLNCFGQLDIVCRNQTPSEWERTRCLSEKIL